MPVTLFGIPNCDTVKKARAWLDVRGVEYAFHDHKKQGVDEVVLDRWIAEVGWELLLNRAGTTFRKLPEKDKVRIDAAKAKRLMLEQPSMIKRPVVEGHGKLLVGFKPDQFEGAFG